MFTGIIEDLGTVESLKPTDQGAVISVHTSLPTCRNQLSATRSPSTARA